MNSILASGSTKQSLCPAILEVISVQSQGLWTIMGNWMLLTSSCIESVLYLSDIPRLSMMLKYLLLFNYSWLTLYKCFPDFLTTSSVWVVLQWIKYTFQKELACPVLSVLLFLSPLGEIKKCHYLKIDCFTTAGSKYGRIMTTVGTKASFRVQNFSLDFIRFSEWVSYITVLRIWFLKFRNLCNLNRTDFNIAYLGKHKLVKA